MFRAVVKEDIVALRELLQIPRNVNAVNKAGETPLDIAISRKKKAAEQLIRAHGGLTHIALAAKQGREVGPTSIVAAAAAMRKMKDSVSKSSVSSPASPSRPATAPAADEVDGVVTRRIDLSATPATGAEFFDSPVAPAAASDPLLGVDTKEPQTDPELVAVISSMKEEMKALQIEVTRASRLHGLRHGAAEQDALAQAATADGHAPGGRSSLVRMETVASPEDMKTIELAAVRQDAERVLAESKFGARQSYIFTDEEAAFDAEEAASKEITPAQVEQYEQHVRGQWLKMRDEMFPASSDRNVLKIKLAFREKVCDLDKHLSIFQVLWLQNASVWPCHNEQLDWWLGKYLVYNKRVSFQSWATLMTLVVLVLLVQVIIPFFLIKTMVNQNHDSNADETVSFCPQNHHTPVNKLSCVILIIFLIGTVVTSAPRSRLLCLQHETYECTREESKGGRIWLALGFVVTTIMQIVCTGATYVLFIEYELLPDLLLNAVALVFVLEADTLMSKIYLNSHLTDSADCHDAKNHWFEHARGTEVGMRCIIKHSDFEICGTHAHSIFLRPLSPPKPQTYARYGLLAGHSTLAEWRTLIKCKLSGPLTAYMVVYLANCAWQFAIFIMMTICY